MQFERLKYGTVANDQRGRRTAPASQMSVPENEGAVLVVTEANSRIDMNSNYSPLNKNTGHEDRMKTDEVDQLIEWTQNLPTNEDQL